MPKPELTNNIRIPSSDEWEEILKNFDLSDDQANQLKQGIVEIADNINRDIAFQRRASGGRDQKETTKHFDCLSKALTRLETLLNNDDQNSNKLLSELFCRDLAELLGNRGLENLLPGYSGPQPPSIHDLA